MKERIFCIEILGEGAYHKFLCQNGFSGKEYLLFYNAATNSHLRAYRRFEDYIAERVDLHKATGVWALVANLVPADQVDRDCFVGAEEKPVTPLEEPPAPAPEQGSEQSDDEEESSDSESDDPSEPAKRKRGRPKKEVE